ncbi:spore coat U domain-containing protein [Sphingopyxis sp. JAI128]|uniref:Csu type fimbrial protein n=1 Tax=Sphingopyxis sp. JAI128 TaxID=2723066 RepID=UPI0016120762|nr:spore coat U domain-containing protein [Sphingopyxis sp. JAI128]MBB6428169.1 spore coat protein U-like protein [Sphingopyxis sp. JAI128]
MFRLILILAAPLFFFLSSGPAQAQAANCSFNVSNVDFGSVDTLAGAAVDTAATVSVSCMPVTGARVRACISLGAGSGGATAGLRHMLSGADILDYNLYQDAARTIPWGTRLDPSLGTPVALDFSGAGGTQNINVYGRVFGAQQAASAGLYTSSLTATDVMLNAVDYGGVPSDCSAIMTNTKTAGPVVVQAEIDANCFVAAQNIDFGNQGGLAADVDSTGEIDVTCTPGLGYTVALDNGLTGTGPTTRQMALGGDAITYGLYKDGARSQPWGVSGAQRLSGTGAGAAQTLPVYARVPAQTTPPAGTYSDTVVVTVEY